MGIAVMLTTEDGRAVGDEIVDPKNYLHRLLPLVDSDSCFLKYIDWYGDTVFNRPQAADFLAEWLRLEEFVENDEERQIVEGVARLARTLHEDVHLYLRFEGD